MLLAAKYLFDQAGGFGPWSMGSGGWTAGGDPMYGTSQFYGTAQDTVQKLGLGDLERAALMSSAGSGGAPMVFNNTFNVSGGAGGGGVDVGRLVTQVADRLEPELRRRALATA